MQSPHPIFKVGASVFSVSAGAWHRAWRLTPQGALTAGIGVADWAPDLAGVRELSECYYQGLLRLDMHRPAPVFPELRLQGDLTAIRLPPRCGEGACEMLAAEWVEPRQGVWIRREWRVYPGTDAVAAVVEIAADSAPQLDFGRGDYLNVLDALPLNLRGWDALAVAFFGRTDYTNELVRPAARRIDDGMAPFFMEGNLLFLEPPGGGRGIFILHEGPPPDEKRPECAAAFRIGPDGVQILGWGMAPQEVLPDRCRRSYTAASGGYLGGELARLGAVRAYLQARYPADASRPATVANPWGDGQCYKNLGEAFLLRELDACAEMGLGYYQVDDGWQAGGVLADLSIHNLAAPVDYWDVHAGKFPRGFQPLADRAAAAGVRLSLWFAPDANRHYRTWQAERDLLLRFHREYGIDLFKIDAVKLPTREAEENLTALLEGVMLGSNGRVRFNMDVTNGRRMGYFASLRFGDIFVENRYLRPGKAQTANTYVPWRVLRNLWELARYLPPARLQFEFPNRNKPSLADAAGISTALELRECRDDYLAAITLPAAPLCWGEPSGFPETARAGIGKIMQLHQRWRRAWSDACVLPIGDAPTGHAWTGFQFLCPSTPGNGWLMIFREDTAEDRHEFRPWSWPEGARLECLTHPEHPFDPRSAGGVCLRIPRPNDYRLYKYGTMREY